MLAQTAISKASQKPEKQSKKQISQNENRKVQTAQRALITLEKDTNRTNLEKAREAIGQVKHSKDKESLQRQFNILEQAIYFTEAEATIKELEIKKTKHLIESAKQKVNLVSNTNKRNALRNRIDSVTKAIEDQEVQQAAANNAEIAIQQLENN
ncbi:hypothetical protein [Streptococcus dysgalactiae]|uniref:hypothetical protein n=1 Tax=Streptococcus dysgalactiae TaxID=1334 RepID=UPI0024B74EFC|nr:hypothetical protein [Streptococcus dysgalactiae]MCB2830739.1 hypothetical protein [Streptococcus dysgalactiae subsp. dysgalactiae]